MNKVEPWKVAACLIAIFGPLAACGRDEAVEVKEREVEEQAAGERAAETEAVQPESRPVEETAPQQTPPQQAPPEQAPPQTKPEAPPPPAVAEKPPVKAPPEETAEAEVPAPPAPTAPPPAPPPAPAPPPPAADVESAGKQVFLAQRCGTCHSVSTAGIQAKMTSGPTAGGDLAGIGKRRGRASIQAILRHQEMIAGKKHRKLFTGSQRELDALVDWLLSQG